MQLRAIKDVIDTSLGELQYLLDNTSKFLNSIDEEYNRIKQRILDYTSQALDAGFTKYRQNMVNWAKYEEVELKTKLMVQQLEKTIKEDEVMI
jgi:archaellum component FlaC